MCCTHRVSSIYFVLFTFIFKIICLLCPQNKEGILPSSDTVYRSICSQQIYVNQQRRVRGGNFVIGFINFNKYTSASENVHLCFWKCTLLPLQMYTSGSENVHLCFKTVNWVTLVSLLVEYLIYSVLQVYRCRVLTKLRLLI